MKPKNLLLVGLFMLAWVILLVVLIEVQRNEEDPLPTATPVFTPVIEAIPAALGNTEKVVIPDLRWPIGGPISAYYGANHPLGIDIDSQNDSNQPVVAVADGTVLFTGSWRCCSYGLYVVIIHPISGGEIETLYAHLDSFAVKQGRW